MTVEDMLAEYYAHNYFENPKAAEQDVEDDDFDLEEQLQRLNDNPDDWEDLV